MTDRHVPSALPPATDPRRRALVVDDSRTMRRILKSWLAEFGFDNVSEAGNGLEALDVLRDPELQRPVVAFVDWNMPEMDGLELVRHVRDDDALRSIVLIMVTSEVESSAVVRALIAGADEYVMKPVTKDVLAGKLALLGLLPAGLAA